MLFGRTDIKIISYNVMSLKTILNKGFMELIKTENPDVILLQEIKIKDPNMILDAIKILNYEYYDFNIGKFGTCFFSKIKPLSWENINLFDEGRIMKIKFTDINLYNIYAPNAGENLKFMEKKNEWFKWFNDVLNENNSVLIGDMNVVYEDKDIWISDSMRQSYKKLPGYTDMERIQFKEIIEKTKSTILEPFDSKKANRFTFYSIRSGVNKDFFEGKSNKGWRLDYCIHNTDNKNLTIKHLEWKGSDHIPILISYKSDMKIFNQPLTTVSFKEIYDSRMYRQTKKSDEKPMYKMFEYADYYNHKIYIACQNATKLNYEFISFRNKAHFEEAYKSMNKNCYEVIRENNMCHLYLDLDIKGKGYKEALLKILDLIKVNLDTSSPLIMESSNGYHVIYTNKWYINNSYIDLSDIDFSKYDNILRVDKKVYTKNRLMRILYSSKMGEIDPFVPFNSTNSSNSTNSTNIGNIGNSERLASDYFISMS